MVEILLVFIAASLLLYVVLAGADYGAGILELLPAGELREEERKVVNYAMGPVWEANHMWLVLLVVILFMGFPGIFGPVMIHLHLPIVALLVGIVVRGTAFTFRHYDAIHEPRSQNAYSVLFGVSSLWSAFWIGVIAASLERGQIDTNATEFWSAYVAPWWGHFPFAVGVFVVAIFAFLASMYLVGETDRADLKRVFLRRGFVFNMVLVLAGGWVLLASDLEGNGLVGRFLSNPLSVASLITATALFALLWSFARHGKAIAVRVVSAGQAALILFGWSVIYSPIAVMTKQGPISFYDGAAPEATLIQLVVALVIGSLLIFPSLLFLVRVFKKSA